MTKVIKADDVIKFINDNAFEVSVTPPPDPEPIPPPEPSGDPGTVTNPYMMTHNQVLSYNAVPGKEASYSCQAAGYKRIEFQVSTYNAGTGASVWQTILDLQTGVYSATTLLRNSGGLFFKIDDFSKRQYIFTLRSADEWDQLWQVRMLMYK